ncbi:hypothetical protein HNR46_001407 [Haloferula luteola]|uniref:Uncharacterized protein n=1 Tax=Haloferula luteola TaxID=595692 RepID=A0A840V1B6_9BACT|nr:hypothetical protein [Haloferula luteola]MBB5351173.1 hypothetical protein [Haloferula luteola]
MSVAEPHKELRFTRARQAAVFFLAAGVALSSAVTLVAIAIFRGSPHPAWAALPCALAIGLIRLALHCARHAYLILTPIGIEIFPLIRPASGMQVVAWSEIIAIDIEDEDHLTLHFNSERTAGIHLTLSPISHQVRPLLIRALEGRAHR